MTSTVEQCKSKSLGPLSSTLEMFDTFKTSQDDEKDSDEESFHLPLLGCDDDIENGKGTGSPTPETEDDILNKFEGNSVPDLDPKMEESILNEDDEHDTKDKKLNYTVNSVFHDLEVVDETDEENNSDDSKNDVTSTDNCEKLNENTKNHNNIDETIPNHETQTDEQEPSDGKVQDEEIVQSDIECTENLDERNSTLEQTDVPVGENENEEIDDKDMAEEPTEEIGDTQQSDDKLNQEEAVCEEIIIAEGEEKIPEKMNTQDVPSNGTSENENEVTDSAQIPGNGLNEDSVAEPMETDSEKSILDKTENLVSNAETSELGLQKNDEGSANQTENHEEESKESQGEKEEAKESQGEKGEAKESQGENEKSTETSEETTTNEKDDESNAMDTDESKNEENPANIDNTDENVKKDEENSQTETEEKDLECDDLLDISVIRDADEDNASAIADIDGAHSSEKSDEDEKQENEDDIEAEPEDTLMSNERDEPMEFDDNTNSCDQDTSTTDNLMSEHTSDGENKENEPLASDSNSQNPPIDDVTDVCSNESSAQVENKTPDDASGKEAVESDSDKPVESVETKLPEEVPDKPNEEIAEKLKENSTPISKRPLSETDKEEVQVATKKIRLSQEKTEEKKKSTAIKTEKIKTLINFEQFMKKRSLGEGKLTRSDLEQFCLQKICEAMVHKTEVGELHQTIKKLELTIDILRKDLQQLGKQTRDLDIVNKKLMSELRTQNGNQKPLVPLKITRSVGLQVKLNIGMEPVNRRKTVSNTNTPKTPTTPNNTNNNNNNTPAANRPRNVSAANSVVRQVVPATPPAASPRKTPAAAPLLSQALQTRVTPTVATPSPATANKRITPARPKNAEPARPKNAEPAKPSAPGVIDLTDEDDRIAKSIQKGVGNKNIGSSVKILNKNINLGQNKGHGAKVNNAQTKTVSVGQVKSGIVGKVGMQARPVTTLPQGVRLTTAQMKNGITIPASVVTSTQGTTQLMYVVQPGSLVNTTAGGGQKAVLLNFQPTNGVLTSTINGSTVSVIPSKNTNTMQLKTISPPRKHPAPLPLPPPAIVNSSLKKILPKPHLSIRKTDTGIILQWRMPYNLEDYEGIASYQLFAYQETNAPPSTDMWRKVGDVKALALPMACTLTQFADKNKYYFAVRSVDVHKRIGAFSDPEEISL